MSRRGSRQAPSRVNDRYATPDTPATRRAQMIAAQYTISGPLPAAEELERYRAIVPDMPERLLANFEKQTEHRIDLEQKVVYGDLRRSHWGLVLGWIFAMSLLVASVYLIASGHEGIGVTALLGELAVLGGSFAYSDYRRRQERNRRSGG